MTAPIFFGEEPSNHGIKINQQEEVREDKGLQ
jgi:hypothetical protein